MNKVKTGFINASRRILFKNIKNLEAFSLIGLLFIIPDSLKADVWQREAPDSTGINKGAYCSLALDSKDNPHIAYYDDDFQDLRYASFLNGIWTVEIVDSVGNAGDNCSLALDNNDRPYISYRQDYQGHYWSLKYATKTDSGWVKIMVDTPKDTTYYESGEYSSIAINNNGFPCISYTQYNPSKIKFAYQDEYGWHLTDVIDIYTSYFTKLVFDNADQPVIGFHYYEQEDTVYHNRLKIAHLNPADSTWSIVTVPDSIGSTDYGTLLGFDMDSQNNAYFTYQNYWYDYLRLAVYDGQNWNIETVTQDPGLSSSPGLTLKVDRLDQPAIVEFYYSDEVRLYQKVNGQWQCQTVDKEEYGINPLAYCSLDFNSDNYPRIAIHGRTTSYTRIGLFYYRYWPGNAQISIPETTHDFGNVWIQSYSDWSCFIENQGDAPVIINEIETYLPGDDTSFQVINTSLPITVLPNEKDSISIRFKPPLNTTYIDTLFIYSNDSLQTKTKITLQGTGTSSGTTGSIQINVNNIYIDHQYQLLKYDIPLKNAKISLYQNSQLVYGPATTNSAGLVYFSDINTGNYDLKIIKPVKIHGSEPGSTILDSLGITTTLDIGPGANSKTILLPDSLIVEKYQDIYNLTHINKTSWNDHYIFSYPSEDAVHSLLDTWKPDLPLDTKSGVSRLIVAEGLTYQMFDGGYSIGKEFMSDIGELVNLVKYSENWGTSIFEIIRDIIVGLATGDPLAIIKDILMEVLQEFLQNMLLNLITDGVHQVTAEIGPPGENIVNTAWDVIKDNYSGWSIGLFSASNWGDMAGEIYKELKDPIFQKVYINLLTDNKIEKALDYSRNFQYNGEFKDAYQNSNYFIADKLNEIENSKDICVGLRVSADLFNKTASVMQVLELLSAFPGGIDIIVAISEAMQITSYVEVLSALGISGYTFFTLPDDIDNAIENIYFHDRKNLSNSPKLNYPFQRSKTIPQINEELKGNLEKNISVYDSILLEIKNQINTGNSTNAIMLLNNLMQAENDLRSSFTTSAAPIYSVASLARDSLVDFQPMYDSLISSYSFAGEDRFKNYLYILFSSTDSSQAMKDTISAQIDRSSLQDQALKDQILATLNTISDMSIPAIVVANLSKQDRFGLKAGETATVQLQVQNVGSLPAENVSIIIKNNPAIQFIEADSIYVGDLLPGEKSNVFTWTTAGILNSDYIRGVWTAEIHSSNAKTYSTSGSFKIMNEATGIMEQSIPLNRNVFNYPNPFNPDIELTTIHYILKKTTEVTLKIYDINGKLVRILMNKVPELNNTEHIISWNGKNEKGIPVINGLYFFVIKTTDNERLTGKIMVMR
jgi:hypothetical protein